MYPKSVSSFFLAAPTPPVVSISPFNPVAIAGDPLSLICSASIQEGIRGISQLTWTRKSGALPNDATSFAPFLNFSSLHPSYGGDYTCSARLIIQEADVDISGSNTTIIFVMDRDDTNTTSNFGL